MSSTKPIISTYTRCSITGDTIIYKHLEGDSPLASCIRLDLDMWKSMSNPRYWIKECNYGELKDELIGGMFNTSHPRWMYRMTIQKDDLIVFEMLEFGKILRVLHFNHFYPKNPRIIVDRLIEIYENNSH